jgi:hypothetical protein
LLIVVDLEQQIERLDRLSPAQLRSLWRDVYRAPAPDLSPGLLARGIAYRQQERLHGGLSRTAEKQIAAITKRLERTGSVTYPHFVTLKTGTRLVRSWNGKVHSVLVCEAGFEFDGRQYASLTQIARDITGARWSGPRFFGLKKTVTDRRLAASYD